MVLRRFTLALVSLGLLGSPLSALFCAGDGPAAMTCCRNDPQGCNRGGKSDDCCRSLPNDGSELATLVKSAHVVAPTAAVMPLGVSGLAPSALSAGRRVLVAESHVWLDLPPPLLSPLRI